MEKKNQKPELTTRAYAYQYIYTDGVIGQEVTYDFMEAFKNLNGSQGKIEGLLATKIIFRSNGTFANKGKRYLMRGEVVKAETLNEKKVKFLFKDDIEECILTSSGVAVPKTKRVKLLAPFYVADSRK